MKISAVIPTLNAAQHLPACLEALVGVDEILVVDGGSIDSTQSIAHEVGVRFIEAPRGRGTQLASGAEAARGEILLFVHADTRLSPGWLQLAHLHAGRSTRPACFRFRLDDPAWQARIIERGVALRTRIFGLPYGDQGLLIRRDAYDRSGGFRPLAMLEDVDLLRRIERPIMLAGDALTSAERWQRDGWTRRSLRNLACISLWHLGVSPDRIAALYQPPRPAWPSSRDRGSPAE